MTLKGFTSSGPLYSYTFHRIAGNLFFAVMLVYSIVYAVERIAYVDSAWLSFERINGEKFSFPGDRYGAFISEIPLYIATKLHLPLNVLVYVFSASYIILYYFVWRLCTFTLKNPAAGLVVMFGMVVGVRESFLHTVSETHQCIAYSALLLAVMMHDFRGRMLLKNAVAVATVLLVLFTHPMGIFTSAFVLGYYFTEKRKLKDPLLWLIAACIAAVALLNFLFPPNVYDEAQYDRLASASSASSFLDSGALRFLLLHFPHFYWLAELAGLIVITAFVLRREWLKLALTVGGVFGYIAIAGITFRNGDSSIMIERVFLPAFFMINLAFAHWITRETRLNKWIPMVLVVFFLVNGIRFINAGCLMYKKRVAYLDGLVQKGIAQGSDKYFLSEANTDMDKILVPWALGTETLIYSKLKYDKCISISMKDETCGPESVRLTRDYCLPVTQLNSAYFSLSAKPYEELR